MLLPPEILQKLLKLLVNNEKSCSYNFDFDTFCIKIAHTTYLEIFMCQINTLTLICCLFDTKKM